MLPLLLPLSAGLLTLVTPTCAQLQLPYNPTRIVPAQNGSVAYVFSPEPSSTQFTLSWLNTSESVNSSSVRHTLLTSLPFLSKPDQQAFSILPPDEEGVSVIAGDCNSPAQDLRLWRFTFDSDFKNGSWASPVLKADDGSLHLNYLSAGFTFSPTDSLHDVSLYLFGGMCPNRTAGDASAWVTDATYSNTMLTVEPNTASANDSPYELSLTGARAPPVAEAGLTVTPLMPTFSNTSNAPPSQQQNFVLLGGHTENAFINMSQLAVFSLPQASWAFVNADRAENGIEPRSGHTAVLTDDGSKIVVLGGWVGDVNTPAQPPLIVLEVAQEYGGQGDWAWTIPTSTSSPFSTSQGIYAHGATMLSGGVMMVAGGHSIGLSGSKGKRTSQTQCLS